MRIDYSLNLLGTIISFIGLSITLITFLRVNTVRKAQAEERKLVRQLYGTDQLTTHLRAAAGFLKLGPDIDAKMLADELVRLIGQIEGITRALEAMQSQSTQYDGAFQVSDDGYFTLDSLRADLRAARSAVDILIYRNMFVSSPGILESMESAAARGVKIRILCVSSAAPDDVLRQTLSILPKPVPDTPDEFRAQLGDAEQRIQRVVSRDWSANACKRFEYRGYTRAPVWHMIRVDGMIKLGFVGTSSPAQPPRYEDRPYLLIPVNSAPGEILCRNVEDLWQLSSANVIRGAKAP